MQQAQPILALSLHQGQNEQMINIGNTRHTIEKIQIKKEQEKKNKKQIQTNNMVPV